ncbi:hypothetical protein B0T14DRAFT_510808 [Immersiella caudata]|uniref:Uncharacterized protein n=1 Tax=Immersiella caudata TaxID=314043 RepID=A0AA40C6G8_9PEZI|nr:hypothetical protein B0T14DRAFT_510808 [Immersiella caudata]
MGPVFQESSHAGMNCKIGAVSGLVPNIEHFDRGSGPTTLRARRHLATLVAPQMLFWKGRGYFPCSRDLSRSLNVQDGICLMEECRMEKQLRQWWEVVHLLLDFVIDRLGVQWRAGLGLSVAFCEDQGTQPLLTRAVDTKFLLFNSPLEHPPPYRYSDLVTACRFRSASTRAAQKSSRCALATNRSHIQAKRPLEYKGAPPSCPYTISATAKLRRCRPQANTQIRLKAAQHQRLESAQCPWVSSGPRAARSRRGDGEQPLHG